MIELYFAVALALFVMGSFALVVRDHPIVKLIALNLMGIAVFMWLTTSAYLSELPDAIPHALVLTGIVVAVSATAFGLALLVKIHQLDDQGDERH